ncbi:MAG TPA: tyrosine-type recombinase/integrase [Spirochaetia bacterium]|nr:tyrosine-type recombinase/integrase [Spirochaetia bacterium]
MLWNGKWSGGTWPRQLSYQRRATQRETLKTKEFLTLLEKAKNTLLHIFILAVSKCMRRGEILALHWREVDLKHGTLSIKYNLSRRDDGELVFGKPKTKKSQRTLKLPSHVIQALQKHKAKQNEDRLKLGKACQNNDLVV